MMQGLRAWVKASRPPSQLYIGLGLLLGEGLAWRQVGAWSWGVAFVVLLFGVFDQLFIVYANDLADQETDAQNATWTIFSGGSRALVEGEVTAAGLRRAAWVCGAGLVGAALALGVGWGRWWALAGALAALLLLQAYSFGPLRLSYRGGGEVLQMVGVGLVLPLVGYYAQAGSLAGFPWWSLASVLPLQLSCGMCTAQPDAPSDAASGKRTTAVWMGGATARRAIVALNVIGLGLFPLVGWMSSGDSRAYAFVAAPLAATLGAALVLRRAAPGTRWMLAFVFLGLLAVLAFMGTAVVALLLERGGPWSG